MSDTVSVSTPEQAFNAANYWLAVDTFLSTVTGPNGISFSGFNGQFHEQLVGMFDEHELAEIEVADLMHERHPEVSARTIDAAAQLAGHASRASAIIEALGEQNGDTSFERLGMLSANRRDTILGMLVEIASVTE